MINSLRHVKRFSIVVNLLEIVIHLRYYISPIDYALKRNLKNPGFVQRNGLVLDSFSLHEKIKIYNYNPDFLKP